MTTDDLRARAREAAEARWPIPTDPKAPVQWHDIGMASGFVLGALWHAAQQPTREQIAREARAAAYREWFTPDPILARGYWLIPCDDCAGTGRFPVPDGYDGDPSCVRCKSTGTVPLCMADPGGAS